MDKDHIKSEAKVTGGKATSKPETTTKTKMTKDGKMIVEVTTIFEVDNPDEVFSLKGSGITMTVDTVN
jgi:hypothetical protein